MEDGPWSSAFMPQVWVGNDDLGLAWFAESDQYWAPKDDEAIIDLVDEVPLQAASEEAAGPAEKIHAEAPEAAGESTAPVPDAAFQASAGEAEEAPEPAEASFQAEAPAGEADGSLPDAAAADAALPAERPTDEFEEEALPPPGEMPETEENVIEFSGAPADVAPPASEEVDAFALDEVLESEAIEEPEQDFADDIGLALEEEDDGVPAVQAPSGPVDVTADQVEAAVERVLERLFSEKIEAMIGDAIEKAVSKEIEALKAALMEDHG
jgi:hypothetical protein